MWQTPSQRTRAISAMKSKAKSKIKRVLHIQRVDAELRLLEERREVQASNQDEVIGGRLLLNDINHIGIEIFCTKAFMPSQSIAISFRIPELVYLKGRITFCQEIAGESHIISHPSYHYRIGVKFEFANPEEEKAVRDLAHKLHGTLDPQAA